jgi:hypothetical protein
MRCIKLTVISLAIFLFGFSSVDYLLCQTPVFGPVEYERDKGAPRKVVSTFYVQNTVGEFELLVQNGEGKRGKVSSAVIKLNGNRIVGPNEFSKKVDLITKTVQLEQSNVISVEVRSEPGTSLIVTILGDDIPVSPLSGVTINPDVLFVNEPEFVIVRAVIPYDSSAAVPLVFLQRVDKMGSVLGDEGSLTDDGNLSNGDEVAGDGLFSFRKLFQSETEERIRFRLFVQQGSSTFTSGVFILDVFNHLDAAVIDGIVDLQKNAYDTYTGYLTHMSPKGAANKVLKMIKSDPSVLQAGFSENGTSIWIFYSSGLLGGVLLNPEGTRGGAKTLFDSTLPASKSTDNFNSVMSATQVENKKAIVLGAFNSDFGTTDDAPEIRRILRDSKCPTFEVKYLLDGNVTVNVIKTLNKYGVVAITTHGDTYYKGLLSWWKEEWGWNSWFGQVVFLTGETVTNANRLAYEKDLKKGRLAISGSGASSHYAILPSFIRYYGNNKYSNSLIYLGSCRATYNNSMANAFLSNGAKTFLGYSEYVNSGFAGTVGVDFFERLVEDASLPTTGDAFISGQHDTNTPAAYFQMIGSTAHELPDSGLQNGEFEAGQLDAWNRSGDGRVLTQLGQFSPQGGSYMGLISTGLGYTTVSGSISQGICLPAAAKKLEFYWNFNSEEFVEWCGSPYQDYFRVDILTETGFHNLFYRKVDDLCGSVYPSNLKFDQSSGYCYPGGGNDCTVWSTGWRFASLDISSIATANQGKTITIRFSAGDVGDSIFDSAIILDKIKIVE